MRILVLSGYWPVNANPITGIFIQQQVEEYVHQGNDVIVIAPVPFGRPSRQRPMRLEHGGAEVLSPRFLVPPGLPRLPPRLRAAVLSWITKNFAKSVLAALEAENIGNKFDVIHVNGIVFAGLALPRLRENFPLPSVMTIHGDDQFLAPIRIYEPTRRELSEMWECLSRVVLVGTPLKSYASALHAPEEKLVVVPNGTKLLAHEDNTSSAGNMADDQLNLISVSNLNSTKGIQFNIEAIRNLARISSDNILSYTIIGEGPERKKLEKLVHDFGLADKVHFTGRLPHDQTMELVGRADIFSLPSYVEAFGIVYIEAMARGIPVIGCEGTGAEDIITNGETGILVKQQDVADLTRALEQLLLDPALRARMARNARRKATQFSWAVNVRHYVAIFKEIQDSV